jgi:hypothetical protein
VGPTDLLHPSPPAHFKTSEVFMIFFEVSKFKHFVTLFLKFTSNLLVNRVFFLLNVAFAVAILDFISHVHLVSLLSGYPDSWNTAHFPFKLFVNLCSLKLEEFHTHSFKCIKKIYEIITLLKGAPNFSLREWKRNETKVAEEYCWAVTHTAGRS